jgi:hypothetical protein
MIARHHDYGLLVNRWLAGALNPGETDCYILKHTKTAHRLRQRIEARRGGVGRIDVDGRYRGHTENADVNAAKNILERARHARIACGEGRA